MTDYIDRKTALSFPFANEQYDHENANENFILGCETYKEWLENLPVADAQEVRHGKWHESRFGNGITVPISKYYICNQCSHTSSKKTRYCPNCGAKMDGKGNEK